jgi:hypothetical protein
MTIKLESKNKAYQALIAAAMDGRICKNPTGDEITFFAKESAIEDLRWRKIKYKPMLRQDRFEYEDGYDFGKFYYKFTLQDVADAIEKYDPNNPDNAQLMQQVLEQTQPLAKKQVGKAYGRQ